MDVPAVALMGALGYTLTNFLKSLRGGDLNGLFTQGVAWVVGLVVVFVCSAAVITSPTKLLNGIALNDMDFWSKVILGFLFSSIFGFGNDLLAAIDHTRSSAKPDLLPPVTGDHVP